MAGIVSDANVTNSGLIVRALSQTSDATKELIGVIFKNNTEQSGITFSSKLGVAYINTITASNGQTMNLILGGYDGAGTHLESIKLLSTGTVAMPTLQVGNAGLSSGDLWSNSGVVTIV